ncbi:hypothetical protein FIBSPDRAFT_849576, partial [Athelia psychrophila]
MSSMWYYSKPLVGEVNIAKTVYCLYVQIHRELRLASFKQQLPPVPGKWEQRFSAKPPPPRAPGTQQEIDEYNGLKCQGMSLGTLLIIFEGGLVDLDAEVAGIHKRLGHHLTRAKYSLYYMRKDRTRFQEEISHIKDQLSRVEYMLATKYGSVVPAAY